MASMAGKASGSLLDHFSALEDPRQSWKVVYPLPELLLLVLCATLGGAENFVEMEEWGADRLDFLRRFLPYERGIASHDTLNDVMNALDGELFSACFTAWVDELREAEPDIVAIDGKTSRRTHARSQGRDPLHLVSAWASRQRLVLGQQACAAKSNEITAIPLLLERLALTGALVTIDAMGCQAKIAQTILDKGADYLLAVKDNWPTLCGEIEGYFADAGDDTLDRLETTDGDHGRIEVRRHAVSRDVAWLSTDRRFPGEPRFPGLKAIAMVEAEVERQGKISRERRYFLSSAPLDARLFARAVRCHWHIENRLHWVLDVVFHDDLSRLRSACGPQNMAVVKHMAMNLIRNAPGKQSLTVRRKKASWN
ncbi:ISAs1 family transposase, partial [Nitrospirillum amazonense]